MLWRVHLSDEELPKTFQALMLLKIEIALCVIGQVAVFQLALMASTRCLPFSVNRPGMPN